MTQNNDYRSNIRTMRPKKSQKRKQIEVSVVVPVWNDAESIERFLPLIEEELQSRTKSYEIIFCVDPSSDGTEEKIRQ